jgi:hypothetical protein
VGREEEKVERRRRRRRKREIGRLLDHAEEASAAAFRVYGRKILCNRWWFQGLEIWLVVRFCGSGRVVFLWSSRSVWRQLRP